MYLDYGKGAIACGDSRDLLHTLPDNSIDSVVCDPPYALVSIVKRFGGANAAPAKGDIYARASAGFMGKTWDTGETAFAVEFWEQVLRVLKPGGHAVAFSGTRTYHRLACAVEDAGFEIRDMLCWHYGSGFPKGHNVARGIDTVLGASGGRGALAGRNRSGGRTITTTGMTRSEYYEYIPASASAQEWQGWSTALKPATEPIVFARKPLVGTVASNVLRHGTGAINISGCRIESEEELRRNSSGGDNGLLGSNTFKIRERRVEDKNAPPGRWPANLLHDGSEEVLAGLGEASRFFYCAKASKSDRGPYNSHPTVKPTELMRWLCRLVTPPGGTVLDPFMGSGSTGKGAALEGFRFIGFEREPEYYSIATLRILEVAA